MTRKQKWLLAAAAAMLLLCFVGIATAQTAPRQIKVDWQLPTLANDGTPLTGPQALTQIQVFMATATIPNTSTMAPTFTLAAGAVTTTQTFTVPVGGTAYIRLKACNAAGCSDFSNESSKAFPATVPNPPTNLTITIVLASQPSISAEPRLAGVSPALQAPSLER